MIQLLHGDCLELMQQIPDASVDMILADLPFGTTQAKWDSVIPFEALWANYKRVIKRNGAIVLFGSQPFTTLLIASNLPMFRYELVWEKTRPTGFLDAKRKPLKQHENICVFYGCQPGYHPQMEHGKQNHVKAGAIPVKNKNNLYGDFEPVEQKKTSEKYPRSVLKVKSLNPRQMLHPTQKPVALLEYLIRTYTNEGEAVLDNCMGSGSTMVACQNTGRHGIGIEKDAAYFEIARQRIEAQAA